MPFLAGKEKQLSDIVLIIPVYNDWESVEGLIKNAIRLLALEFSLRFILVNDSSNEECNDFVFSNLNSSIVVIELSRNLGHQKAIASGLSYANDNFNSKYIVVMDSDGEDRPEDIRRLLNKAEQSGGVVFAQRAKRTDGKIFLLFYKLYKLLFLLLTGKQIDFGNYCVIPAKYLLKLVHVPDIWNHFSGGIMRSGIPYSSMATEKGKRYYGKSKMNFIRLILHGLSAVSVYTDFMAIRLILLSFFLIVSTIIGIIIVAFVRMFTQLAIPGWATFTVLGLAILLFLALLLGLFLLFNVLAMSTQKMLIPAKDYLDYIIGVKSF